MRKKANTSSGVCGPKLHQLKVLDATCPVVKRRICRIARQGWYGITTAEFWYSVAGLSSLLVGGTLFYVDNAWWVLIVAVAIPGAMLLRMAAVWGYLHTQMDIERGDRWYLWETSEGRALALVKHPAAGPLVLSLVARPRSFTAEFRRLVTHHAQSHDSGNNFLT